MRLRRRQRPLRAPPLCARRLPIRVRSEDLHIVKSPIVGTFYASASPGAEPFVAVGAKVDSGQALCIIEAMKLMNEIESDVAGEIVRIFVENGQPVEYGESLSASAPNARSEPDQTGSHVSKNSDRQSR